MWFFRTPLLLAALLFTTWQMSCAQPNRPIVTVYEGMCDASAAVAIGTNRFVVANDEDSRLRVYARNAGGPPLQILDLRDFLGLEQGNEETDLEGAAEAGDRVYWITSHARNKNAKARPNRHRFFAVRFRDDGGQVAMETVGKPYVKLLEDLLRDARYERFGLAAGSELAPKAPGGLNIEGLCAANGSELLIGFRNPLPQGKALLAPLLNAAEVVQGAQARFGDPILLDLGGRGIREITQYGRGYLIAAGKFDSGKAFDLFTWKRGEAPVQMSANLAGTRPEAFVMYADVSRAGVQVLSDDGGRSVGGLDCKDLPQAEQRFRSFWLPPDIAR